MLKEKDIRPGDDEKRNIEARSKDIRNIFCDSTGKFIKEYLCEIKCPACNNSKYVNDFIKDEFCFKRCLNCDTLYVSPRPIPGKLADYYSNSKSAKVLADELEKTKIIRTQKIFKPRVKYLLEALKRFGFQCKSLGGTVIEVGGGNGIFLSLLKRTGIFTKHVNIEPNLFSANASEKKGIFTIVDLFENVDRETIGECGKAIVSFEVIEHLFKPEDFIKKCHRLLCKKGLLYLTMPNIHGYDLFILKDKSDNIAAPIHLNYFNPKSIEILLGRFGFRVLNIETPGVLDLDIVINKAKQGIKINDIFSNVLLKSSKEIHENFQKFIQKNKLSSHMAVLAQKIE